MPVGDVWCVEPVQDQGGPERSTAGDMRTVWTIDCDLMAHVDGRQVAAAVKTHMPAIAVVMLAGWGQRLIDA